MSEPQHNERPELTAAVRLILEACKQLSRADQKKVFDELAYQAAMREHLFQDYLLRKLEQDQERSE